MDANGDIISSRFKWFIGFLSFAIILLLIRCTYRIDELSDGYNGPLIGNEGLFVGLEGGVVIASAFMLCLAHPGFVWGRGKAGVGKARNG